MNNVLVSVIIPTYNRSIEFFRALDSVCMQTYKNIEIIVVDDNYGNEELRKTIRFYLTERDYRITLLNNSERLGAALSRNIGLKAAHGEYIAFLDDDDECDEKRIEKQLELFFHSKQKKLGLVYCLGKVIYPNGLVENEDTSYTGIPLEEHMKNNIAGTSFWMVKKDAILSVGGFEKISSHQDGIVILKLLANGFSIDVVHESLINYYHHDKTKGITGVTDENLEADFQYFKRCQSYFELLEPDAQRRITLHFYDDRNWNLIMLGKNEEVIKDIKYLFSNYFLSVTWIKCIIRYIFRKIVISKEEQRLRHYGLLPN